MNQDIVFFMKVNEPFGVLTNFSQTGFIFDSRAWKTSEHCYQAMKFIEIEAQELIRSQPNAYMAAKSGRELKARMKDNWDIIRDPIMSDITYAKFSQNLDAKQILLSTDNRLLVELSFKDNYWGSKPDLSGKNKLGKILMHHRTIFRMLG